MSVLGTVARAPHVGAWIKVLRPCALARHAPRLFDTGPKYLLIKAPLRRSPSGPSPRPSPPWAQFPQAARPWSP
eukprot:9994348-Alexandrium_andersonii.AAC.1